MVLCSLASAFGAAPRTLALLGLVGCAWEPALSVQGLAPGDVRPGSPIVLRGEGLTEGTQVWLHGAQGEHRMEVVARGTQLDTVIPDVPPGAYALVITRGTEVVTHDVRVDGVPDEAPCARGYPVNTAVNLPDQVAVVERFYKDGTRERVATALSDIERLEYVDAARGGVRCRAILLRTTDGAALLFEDDDDRDLLARAETLARYMRKDLAIIEGVD